jgi:hypothetical protein
VRGPMQRRRRRRRGAIGSFGLGLWLPPLLLLLLLLLLLALVLVAAAAGAAGEEEEELPQPPRTQGAVPPEYADDEDTGAKSWTSGDGGREGGENASGNKTTALSHNRVPPETGASIDRTKTPRAMHPRLMIDR